MVLANRIEAFASLGQLVREFQEQSQSITDPDTLAYVTGVVRSMISGRNLSVVNVTVDGDTFKGEAQVKVNPRLTKRFSFAIAPDSKTFQPLNADEIEKFAEPVEFKAAGGKTLKCKIEQCGGRCLKGGEKCRLTMKPEERKAHEVALRKSPVDTSLAKKRREMKQGREKAAADAEQEKVQKEDARIKAILAKAQEKEDAMRKRKRASKPATPESKVHSVTKQQDFDDLVMHAHEKLSKKYDGLVPIYQLRREVGELVPRDKFNDWLKEMQSHDKLQFTGGSVEDSAPDKIKDSISTSLDGLRCYARLGERGKEALTKATSRSKELDEVLKNRPTLDPLGTASKLSKGPKIKTQSDFDKVVLDAHKRLNEEFNHDNLVPIADVRKALGDRVSKKDFDNHLFELQSNDKIQLIGDDRAPKDLREGGVESVLGGKQVYMKKL